VDFGELEPLGDARPLGEAGPLGELEPQPTSTRAEIAVAIRSLIA
jgi:hypothetical protein